MNNPRRNEKTAQSLHWVAHEPHSLDGGVRVPVPMGIGTGTMPLPKVSQDGVLGTNSCGQLHRLHAAKASDLAGMDGSNDGPRWPRRWAASD